MITDVGSVYDPLVDKLMQITAVVCMSIEEIIPIWVIYIVAAKEVTMIIVGTVLYLKKMVVHSNWYGKVATVLFYAVIFLLIVFPELDYLLKMTMLALLILVMVLAALGYLVRISGSKSHDLYDYKG